jgi:hypothetical protein
MISYAAGFTTIPKSFAARDVALNPFNNSVAVRFFILA